MQARLSSLLLILFAAACGPVEATVTDPAQPVDAVEGETCGLPYSCFAAGSNAERLTLQVLNNATYSGLRQVYALAASQASKVIDWRDGVDNVLGNADDRTFTSIWQARQITGFTCCTMVRIANIADGCQSCRHDDGVCGKNCTFANDHNCPPPMGPVCGDGKVEGSEVCDGNCPASCNDMNACTSDTLTGSARTCNVMCSYAPITACASGDGCCAPGCNSTNDGDCGPACGNGVVESGEVCDGNCPTGCDDTNACTTDALTGSAATCSAACTHAPVTACVSGDGCCAPGCHAGNDSDCPLATYTLSGDANGAAIYLDDDLVVQVNGVEVFRDSGNGANSVNVTFTGKPGDVVSMFFWDIGWCKAHSAVWLSGGGLTPHQAGDSINGAHCNYPNTPHHPFDIVSFTIPATGNAQRACWPTVGLDWVSWARSSSLTVREATTTRYRVHWAPSNHEYDYTPDCTGWIQDVFVTGSAWATVRWNVLSGQAETYAVAGHAYDATIARAAAQHAHNTIYPGVDMAWLQIR